MPPVKDKINVGLRPVNKTRLDRMRAEAVLRGWSHLRSHDDSIDLLLQIWEKLISRGVVETIIRPPLRAGGLPR